MAASGTLAPRAPPPLFHPEEGRSDCLFCHEHGRLEARPLPAICAAVPSQACLACHVRAEGPAAAAYGGMLAATAIAAAVTVVLLRRRFHLRRQRAAAGDTRRPRLDLRRLVLDGVLQRRLLAGPWPGLAHAALVAGLSLLFAGSLVVQVDTLLLAPSGRGLGAGAASGVLQHLLDLAGLAAALGALLLLWRAILPERRSRPGGGLRIAVLLLLLLVLATGFALQGLRLSLDPNATHSAPLVGRIAAFFLEPLALEPLTWASGHRALWWGHLVLVGSLVALAPLTSLRHAVFAPLNLARGEPWSAALAPPFDLREVLASGSFDVKVGLGSADELDASQRLGLLACTACGWCDDACPAHAAGAALRPSDVSRKLRLAAEADSNAPLIGSVFSADELWSCHLCGACAEACPARLAPVGHLIELRRRVASEGRLDGRRAEVLSQLARTGNPYGLPLAQRRRVALELGLPTLAEEKRPDLVWWLGCAATYDGRIRQVAQATAALLLRAGVRVAVLGGEEACCGDLPRRLGEEGRFQELALGNIDTLARHGVRRVMTHCAHCFHVLAREYPALGASFEVVHHATVLRELVETGALRIQGELPGTVALHDACHLGRLNGLYDAPREVLRTTGLALRELPRSHANAACCGGGGGGYWFEVPRTETPAASRIREALSAGVTALAVECPFCLRMLEDAAPRGEAGARPEIREVSEWLAEALRASDAETERKEECA